MITRTPRERNCLPWNQFRLPLLSCAVVSVGLLGLAGCTSEPEETVVAQPTYTPPPQENLPPPVTPIADLMEQLRIDERVVLQESDAPDNDEARRAILEFFDGFARGDATAVGRMLTTLDRRELDAMVESGQWQQVVDGITRIDIQTGPAGGTGRVIGVGAMGGSAADSLPEWHEALQGMDLDEVERMVNSGELRDMLQGVLSDSEMQMLQQMVSSGEFRRQLEELRDSAPAADYGLAGHCALAMFEVDGDFQVQLWYYTPSGDGIQFEAAPTPPGIVNRLSGTNWIAAWHDIIEYEMVLANTPDNPVKPPQQQLDDEEQSGGSGSTPSSPQGPIGPGPMAPDPNWTPPPPRAPPAPGRL